MEIEGDEGGGKGGYGIVMIDEGNGGRKRWSIEFRRRTVHIPAKISNFAGGVWS